jgi:hypothetical protein
MTIQQRSLVMGSLLAVAIILYGAARFYTPSMTFFVVEQTLIQKAPKGTDGTDSTHLRRQFRAYISGAPDKKAQMERLLQISQYLEKVQQVTIEQLQRLMVSEESGSSHRSS